VHVRGNCVSLPSPRMVLNQENGKWKREREREKPESRTRVCCIAAHTSMHINIPRRSTNIPRRHLPDRDGVVSGEENGEITRKPAAVRYGRVMPEYRVINFRERRLSSCVCPSLSARPR